MLTIGSLFSGIGGLELGLERTGGFRTIWNCEIEEYPSAILRKHWPGVPNLGDITKVDWSKVERPDVLCGGFPCQDISPAGKRKGIQGERSGLWKEFYRAIAATKPTWVIIENSSDLPIRGLGTVLADLQSANYEALRPLLITARFVGAPHVRKRCFVIAHRKQKTQLANANSGRLLHGQVTKFRDEAGFDALDRSSAGSAVLANPTGTRYQGWQHQARQVTRCRGRVEPRYWPIEPSVGRVANGIPNQLDRIKCLGNAVVPQVAQVVGEAILAMEGSDFVD